MRIRLAGIIPMEKGFGFMHRQNVKNHPISDYYVFPGGGREGDETFEDGAIREIKEEFGIDVKVVKELYQTKNEKKGEEHFFLCEYVAGIFGTGEGPEFSGDPKYIDRGTYTPEIIKKEEVKNITLLPPEVKEMLVKDIEAGIFDKYFK